MDIAGESQEFSGACRWFLRDGIYFGRILILRMTTGVALKIRRNVFGRARTWRCLAASLWGIELMTFAAAATVGQQAPAAVPASAKNVPGGARGAKPRAGVVRFRARVDAALAEAHAQKALWGVLVTDRDTGEILYELNADRFFTPASNAKIVTTSLALATLGPTYQFRTTLESSGKLGEDGRLLGDLVFVGRGDPDLSNRKFPYAGKVEHDGPAEKVLAQMARAVGTRIRRQRGSHLRQWSQHSLSRAHMRAVHQPLPSRNHRERQRRRLTRCKSFDR